MEWVSIKNSGFIAADVIRWKESVYRQARSRKRRAVRLGERLVTAEVLNEPDRKGFARLLVRKCEVLTEVTTQKLPPLAPAGEIRRTGKTIMRGEAERLLWSDESVRVGLASKFLGNR